MYQWLNKKGENKRYYDEMGFSRRASGITRKILPEGSRKVLYNILKIAAIFFLAITSSWAAFYFLNNKPSADSLAHNQIMTTKGQKSQITLSDISSINADI